MNLVILQGHLGKAPELRSTSSGQAVANMSLATRQAWTDQSGNKQERTEWHRVVCWGRNAENAAKYLKKGSNILVRGSLQTRDYEDKEGVKRYVTSVTATEVQFLSPPKSQEQPDLFDETEPSPSTTARTKRRPPAKGSPSQPQNAPAEEGFSDDELPF